MGLPLEMLWWLQLMKNAALCVLMGVSELEHATTVYSWGLGRDICLEGP